MYNRIVYLHHIIQFKAEMRFLYTILVFVFISNAIIAQNSTVYEPANLRKFVSIYLESKKTQVQPDSVAVSLLRRTGTEVSDYGNMIRNAVSPEDTLRQKPSEVFYTVVQEYKQEIQSQRQQQVTLLCSKYDMDAGLYNAILERYRNDPSFQNSLVKYFEDYINDLK